MLTENQFSINDYLKGDKILWYTIIAMSMLSLLPVFSAISNLSFIAGQGTTMGHFFKHFAFVVVGLFLARCVGLVKYQYLGSLSRIGVVFMILLLILTAFIGGTSGGASAARWLYIPGTRIGFQPSSLAFLVLIVYISRYLHKHHQKQKNIWEHIFLLFIPIFFTYALVFKENGSTGLIIFGTCIAVLVVGSFPWKLIAGFVSFNVLITSVYVILCLFTSIIPERHNRVKTQMKRFEAKSHIQNMNDKDYVEQNYQSIMAKAAIVNGGITGKGPGKSTLKQRLPQVENDFIFSIIIEEYGFVGAVVILIAYTFLFVRIYKIARKVTNFYATLLVVGIGFMLFCQIFVNMSVSLNIIPVTGQPLPFFSYGGTSILVTYLQIGIVLNISSTIQTTDDVALKSNQKLQQIHEIA